MKAVYEIKQIVSSAHYITPIYSPLCDFNGDKYKFTHKFENASGGGATTVWTRRTYPMRCTSATCPCRCRCCTITTTVTRSVNGWPRRRRTSPRKRRPPPSWPLPSCRRARCSPLRYLSHLNHLTSHHTSLDPPHSPRPQPPPLTAKLNLGLGCYFSNKRV